MNLNTLLKREKQMTDYSKENIIVKEEILEDLHEGICKVTFTKKDGTERIMKCTLVKEYLPIIEAEKVEKNATSNKRNDEVCAVWDVEKNGWRSFRWDSVKLSYLVGPSAEVEGHPV